MLIGGTWAIDHVRRMRGRRVVSKVQIDWPELMAFKRSFTDPVAELQERTYRDKGIDTLSTPEQSSRVHHPSRNRVRTSGATSLHLIDA